MILNCKLQIRGTHGFIIQGTNEKDLIKFLSDLM